MLEKANYSMKSNNSPALAPLSNFSLSSWSWPHIDWPTSKCDRLNQPFTLRSDPHLKILTILTLCRPYQQLKRRKFVVKEIVLTPRSQNQITNICTAIRRANYPTDLRIQKGFVRQKMEGKNNALPKHTLKTLPE